MRIEKLWGWEDIVHNNIYCMKMLYLRPGFQSSMHYHPKKDETFLVVNGCCDLEVADGWNYGDPLYSMIQTLRMVPGDSRHLRPGTPHRFRAVNDGCMIVEASTPHSDTDVVRIEPSKEIK
jgi:mannose-6-phosphate isomerase